MLGKRPAGPGMTAPGREVGQRLEHMGIFEDFGARQPQRGFGNQRAMQQQIQIKRARRKARTAANPPALQLDGIECCMYLRSTGSGFERHGQVQEIVALETHRRVTVHGRNSQAAEALPQPLHSRAHVPLGLDIATDADKHRGHAEGASLSILTPTLLLPLTAPGLCSVTFTRATRNSRMMRPAISSASVSTN